jgi:hypothetical protein
MCKINLLFINTTSNLIKISNKLILKKIMKFENQMLNLLKSCKVEFLSYFSRIVIYIKLELMFNLSKSR